MTRDEALTVVHAYIQPDQEALAAEGDELIVVEPATIERPWGWAFFYTSRLWRETGDLRHAIAGNAPLLIERQTGKLHVTGTAHPIEHYIAAFERCGDPHGGARES
jgi:hypothetical protein